MERKLGLIAVTMLAVWLLVEAAILAVSRVPLLLTATEEGRAPLLPGAFELIAYLTIGVFLLVSRHRLARCLFKDDAPSSLPDATTLLAVALAVLGVWLMVHAASAAVALEADRISTELETDTPLSQLFGYRDLVVQQRASYLSLFLFGLVLFLRAEGLVHIWQRLRQAGRPK